MKPGQSRQLAVLLFVIVIMMGSFFINGRLYSTVNAGTNEVILYGPISGMDQSDVYSVWINGEELFVESFQDVHLARFAFDGHVEVTIATPDRVTEFNISPHSKEVEAIREGRSLAFELSEPSKLMITVNEYDTLFLFADDLEDDAPKLTAPNVVNITDYNVDNSGAVNERLKIQRALDDVAEMPGGGVLYFPNGVYKTGTLHIGSHTHVYLESGALIQGSFWEPGSYQDQIMLSTGHLTTMSGLLSIAEQTNVKISGRGIVDADGSNHRAAEVGGGRLLFIVKSENVHVKDVILRDARSWNTHVYHSDHITLQNIKVINNPLNLTTDGIDSDNSRHVTIDDVLVYAGDDSIAIKSGRWYIGPTRIPDTDVFDRTIKNSVLWSRAAAAMKVGSETDGPTMYGINYINNDVISADVPLRLWVADGTDLSDVNIIDNRVETVNPILHYHHGKRMPIYFQITKRSGNSRHGTMRDIYVKDLKIEQFGPEWSLFNGLDENHVTENVVFENLEIAGQVRTSMDDARMRSNGHINNFEFITGGRIENIQRCPSECRSKIPSPGLDEQTGVVLFHDDFSSDPIGGTPLKWEVTTASGMQIVSDETAIGGHALKMIARPGATTRIDRELSSEDTFISVEYAFKWTEQQSSINHYIRNNGENVINLHFTGGDLLYRYIDNGKTMTSKVDTLKEGWNRIKIVAESGRNEYYLYLNDMEIPCVGAVPLLLPVDDWNQFSIRFFQRQEETKASESFYNDVLIQSFKVINQ